MRIAGKVFLLLFLVGALYLVAMLGRAFAPTWLVVVSCAALAIICSVILAHVVGDLHEFVQEKFFPPPVVESLPEKMPLEKIDRVIFFARDFGEYELVNCEVQIEDKTMTFHEDLRGWPRLIAHLRQLPGYLESWNDALRQKPADDRVIAFDRNRGHEDVVNDL